MQEKLVKALETLHNYLEGLNSDKIDQHEVKICIKTCGETITNLQLRNLNDFSNFLTLVIDLLIRCLDNEDSDVRVLADEQLNIVIKSVLNSHLGRVLVELYKSIKNNGSSRIIRTVLLKFSQLSHLIRPMKCRPFLVNLIPCLTRLLHRPEEPIHETMANAVFTISEHLVSFAHESEIKVFLKAAIPNMSLESAYKRRTAGHCIISMIQFSRHRLSLIGWVIQNILESVVPLSEATTIHSYCGILLFIRLISPLLKVSESEGLFTVVPAEYCFIIYELIMFCVGHSDHNVASFALEALDQLLAHLPKCLEETLNFKNGLPASRLNQALLKKTESVSSSEMLGSMSIENEDEFPIEDDESSSTSSLNIYDVERMEGSLKSDTISNQSSGDVFLDVEPDGEPVVNDSGTNLAAFERSDSLEKISYELDSLQLSDQIGDCTGTGVPIHYCVRLLATRFLINDHGMLKDSSARVSLRTLALACLRRSIGLFPSLNELSVYVNSQKPTLCDVKVYRNHGDPVVRGEYAEFLASIFMHQPSGDIWDNLVTLLDDRSPIVQRLVLHSLQRCTPVFNFDETKMKQLFDRVVVLSGSPYWLVKIELLRLLDNLNLTPLGFMNELKAFSIANLVSRLLLDPDSRVQSAAASVLPKLVETWPSETPLKDMSSQVLHEYFSPHSLESICAHLQPMVCQNWTMFNRIPRSVLDCSHSSLAVILSRLAKSLSVGQDKHSLIGYCQALQCISEKFSIVEYFREWKHFCAPFTSWVLGLLTTSHVSADLTFFSRFCPLGTHLLVSQAFLNVKVVEQKTEQDMKKLIFWNIDESLRDAIWKFMTKLLRILKMCSLAYDDHHQHGKLSSAHFAAMKKRIAKSKQQDDKVKSVASKEDKAKNKEDKAKGRSDSPASSVEPSGAEAKTAEKIASSKIPEVVGDFYTEVVYMREFDQVRKACYAYKMNLDFDGKFVMVLENVLSSLTVLLEVIPHESSSQFFHELLVYLSTAINVLPKSTIRCVQKLLQSLFSSNVCAQVNSKLVLELADICQSNLLRTGSEPFYQIILEKPYSSLTHSFAQAFANSQHPTAPLWKLLAKYGELPISSTHKSGGTNDRQAISNYIRAFEPVVIKSLRLYTLSSDRELQINTLQLLMQLIQLRVNYNLLDSEQVFLNYVLHQFEFLEEGQIRNPTRLIRCIFEFLMMLTSDRYHVKPVITVSKVLQLAEGLIASELDFSECIAPALQPIVISIFDPRRAQTEELETQREVLFAQLKRFVSYTETLELLTVVLQCYSITNQTKWTDFSGAVLDCFCQQPLSFLEPTSELFSVVATLLESLHHGVFLKDASWLKVVFGLSPWDSATDLSVTTLRVAFLRILMIYFDQSTLQSLWSNFDGENPVTLLSKSISCYLSVPEEQMNSFQFLLTSETLLMTLYMFQLNRFDAVTDQLKSVANDLEVASKGDTNNGSQLYLNILRTKVKLTMGQWIFGDCIHASSDSSLLASLSDKARLCLCLGYICEQNDPNSSDTTSNLLQNRITDIAELRHIKVVTDFIEMVQHSIRSSSSLLSGVEKRLLSPCSSSLKASLLFCMKYIHRAQLVRLVHIIIDHFLFDEDITIQHSADLMLQDLLGENLNSGPAVQGQRQFSADELREMKEKLKDQSAELLSLIDKVLEAKQQHEQPPYTARVSNGINEEADHPLVLSPQNFLVNEDWYLDFVSEITTQSNSSSLPELQAKVKLLSALHYGDAVNLLLGKNLDLKLLASAFKSMRTLAKKHATFFQAAQTALLQKLNAFINEVPHPHQPFNICENEIPLKSLVSLFTSEIWFKKLHLFLFATLSYLEAEFTTVPDTSLADVVTLAAVAAELISYRHSTNTDHLPLLFLDCYMRFLIQLLSRFQLADFLKSQPVEYCVSIVNVLSSLHCILISPKQGIRPAISHLSTLDVAKELSSVFELTSAANTSLTLTYHLRLCVLLLCRLRPMSRIIHIPPSCERFGYDLEKTAVNGMLPIDLLQDRVALREFIQRINNIGWVSREEFEESWMSLLAALNPHNQLEGAFSTEHVPLIRLSLRSITTQFLLATAQPQPGNPNTSFLESCRALRHPTRQIVEYHGESLSEVLRKLDCTPTSRDNDYHFGQISLKFLWAQFGLSKKSEASTDEEEEDTPRSEIAPQRSFTQAGLDVMSCLQFLSELFDQWLAKDDIPIAVKHEVCRTLSSISDMFLDIGQYEWSLDRLIQLSQNHMVEDDLTFVYIIYTLGKSIAVLSLNTEPLDMVSKLLDSCLHHVSKLCQLGALWGSLYCLQSGHANLCKVVLVHLVAYLKGKLEPIFLSRSPLILSTAIIQCIKYCLINHSTECANFNFHATELLQFLMDQSVNPELPIPILWEMIKAVEDLLLSGFFVSFRAQIIRFCREALVDPLDSEGVLYIRLMLTCWYVLPDESEDELAKDELVNTIFLRLRKSGVTETHTVASVMATILLDFYIARPSDLINRVINEFASERQPHLRIVAQIMFDVFQKLISLGHDGLVVQWVQLSMASFTQRTPFSAVVWCLTCCMIGASKNQSLINCFQHVVQLEIVLNKELSEYFKASAIDFYNQLESMDQKRSFLACFQPLAHQGELISDMLRFCH